LEKPRDRHDRIIVQEKLEGSCCAVCKVTGQILSLVRAGYRAQSSKYEQHHLFAVWVWENYDRFDALLDEGERLVGEWLAQAHGTRHDLQHEPFVAFDLMRGYQRAPFAEFTERVQRNFVVPHLLHDGGPCSIERVQELLAGGGGHGALDGPEGAVWRVERRGKVDFLVKWVRPDKVDGRYLPEVSGQQEVWNWRKVQGIVRREISTMQKIRATVL
jgi:hypothetical protein